MFLALALVGPCLVLRCILFRDWLNMCVIGTLERITFKDMLLFDTPFIVALGHYVSG